MGSAPTLRPEPASPSRSPQRRYDALFGASSEQPADQPRDRGALPDRLDVQVDHRDRGARQPAIDHARHGLRRHRQLRDRRRRSRQQRRRRASTARSTLRQRAAGLRRHVLLQPRRAAQRRPDDAPQRRRAAGVGAQARLRQPDRHRPRRRARGHHPDAALARRASSVQERELPQAQAARASQLRDLRRPRPWSIGDNVNLAVGQGDVQATPLQIAVAYAAIANGGTVVRPHVGLEIADAARQRAPADRRRRPARHVEHRPDVTSTRSATGLHAAAQQPGGTSSDVFGDFPKPVYGKTGTAQRPARPTSPGTSPTSPTATSSRSSSRSTVEHGGFGAAGRGARPCALILSQWFGVKKRVVAGTLAHTVSAHADPTQRRARSRGRRARPRLLLDPLLLLATLGLVACSLVTLKGATRRRHPRRTRCTSSSARRSTRVVGLVLMLAADALRLLAPARVQATRSTAC